MLSIVVLFLKAMFFLAIQDLFSWCFAHRRRFIYTYDFDDSLRVVRLYMGKYRFMRIQDPMLDFEAYYFAPKGARRLVGELTISWDMRSWWAYYKNHVEWKFRLIDGWINDMRTPKDRMGLVLRAYLWLHDHIDNAVIREKLNAITPGGLWAAYCAYTQVDRVATSLSINTSFEDVLQRGHEMGWWTVLPVELAGDHDVNEMMLECRIQQLGEYMNWSEACLEVRREIRQQIIDKSITWPGAEHFLKSHFILH